jgi:hypothetical protein
MEEEDTEDELRMLFAPGSSLGGARPKVSVREKDGHLAIAKFPRKDDEDGQAKADTCGLWTCRESVLAGGRAWHEGGIRPQH